MSDPKYMSFDPGHTSGYASFDSDAQLIEMGQLIGLEDLMDFLDLRSMYCPPSVVIIEEFRLYQSKALQQSGSKLETVQAIGVIKVAARRWKAQVVEQRADIKGIAQLWSGVKPLGSHKLSHQIDAFNHGVYYLVKNNLRKVEMK